MRKGFTKKECEALERRLGSAQGAIEMLVVLMREKHSLADEWMSERSEAWFETEKCEEFESWMNELV